MTPLAAAAAEHNAADDQDEAEQQRDDIAEAGKGWRRIGRRWKNRINRPSGAPRQRFHNMPARVDDGADRGRCGAEDRQTFLGGAELRLREVLRRTLAADPGVVRR